MWLPNGASCGSTDDMQEDLQSDESRSSDLRRPGLGNVWAVRGLEEEGQLLPCSPIKYIIWAKAERGRQDSANTVLRLDPNWTGQTSQGAAGAARPNPSQTSCSFV